jgi:hypothetical protein
VRVPGATTVAAKISVGEIDPKTNASTLRYAPSFVAGVSVGDSPKVPYTADSIGVFLGEVEDAGHASKVLRTCPEISLTSQVPSGILIVGGNHDIRDTGKLSPKHRSTSTG